MILYILKKSTQHLFHILCHYFGILLLDIFTLLFIQEFVLWFVLMLCLLYYVYR